MFVFRICLALCTISVLKAQYSIQTVAGSSFSGDGGLALSALLVQPEGVALDAQGNLYIADSGDNRVRKVTPDGRIQTLAGTGTPGFSGDGGPATAAQLNHPYGIALDAAGDLYIADLGNARVRVVTADGTMNTLAGGGTLSPVGLAAAVTATRASLNTPRNVAVGPDGTVYVSDFAGQQVYQVSGGILTVVAGNGTAGDSGDGGPSASAQLKYPAGIAVDASGNLYIADSGNNAVREVSKGAIRTLAPAPSPVGLALDASGNVYVAGAGFLGPLSLAAAGGGASGNDLTIDANGDILFSTQHVVERQTPLGNLSVLAGSGQSLFFGDGGPAVAARLNSPLAVAVDSAGALYIADTGNNRIRKVTPDGAIATIAGTGDPSGINAPAGVAVDANGNVYIADTGNGQVEWLAPTGAYSTFLSQLKSPSAVTVDASGNIYVADRSSGRILEVSPAGAIQTVALATAPIALAVDAPGDLFVSDAARNEVVEIAPGTAGMGIWRGSAAPGGLAVDSLGNLFVSDTAGNRIQEIGPQGVVQTIAGTGAPGFSGDGGAAGVAQLNSPAGLAFDTAGNLYVADAGNGRIRRLTPMSVTPPSGDTGAPLTVVNAASGIGASIVSGEIVTIYGSGFDPNNVTVSIGGVASRIFYAGVGQINALAPGGLTPGQTVTVSVASDGAAVGQVSITAAASAPGIFAAAGGGQAAALNRDGSANSAASPVARGSIIVLFATGQGSGTLQANLTIGGQPVAMLYAGPAPGFPGLMQINAPVPEGLSPGNAAVMLMVGGVQSQTGVTIAVR